MRKLFNTRYYKSYNLTSRYVTQLIYSLFNKVKINILLASGYFSAEEILLKNNFHQQALKPLEWMLRYLANNKILDKTTKQDRSFFKLSIRPQFLSNRELEAIILKHDKRLLPSCELLDYVSQEYPNFFYGRKSGVDILFCSLKSHLWRNYFNNIHSGYSVYNHFGAYGFFLWTKHIKRYNCLELGCGTGGATLALLDSLFKECQSGRIKKYILTDISPIFLRQANQLLMHKFPDFDNFILKRLDFNKPFLSQGFLPRSIDIVYSVNALHVADDLLFTLSEIKKILRKGGLLIMAEFIRSDEDGTPHPEFIFNLLDSYRMVKIDNKLRKTAGFLTCEAWKKILEKTGYTNIEIILNSDIDGMNKIPIAGVFKSSENL
jgi:SAM-dependent methyltransferase